MAVSFSDLHTETGLKSLEEYLTGKPYISGDQITRDDVKVFSAVSEKHGSAFPNDGRWYETVSSLLAASFPGKAACVRIGSGAEAAPAVEATKAAPVEEDGDDLDLFGDETEEDKKAADEREAAKKSSAKPKESAKSSVMLDVKPWDDETDMKKLEEIVRSIEMEGLQVEKYIYHELPYVVSAELKLVSFVFMVSDQTDGHDDTLANGSFKLCIEINGDINCVVSAGAVLDGEVTEGGDSCCAGGPVGHLNDPYGFAWLICSAKKNQEAEVVA